MIINILLILLTLAFIVVLLVKRYMYFYPTYILQQPKENYQDIYEGNIHAWFRQGTTDKIILFCHGNAGNLSNRQEKMIELGKTGHSVLIFDYSGFGLSKGVPSEQMCYANADLMVAYLMRNGYSKNNIIPYGESLGGAVASYIAYKYKFPKVIIESGVPSIQKITEVMYPRISKVFGWIFNDFNSIKYLSIYSGDVLWVHSISDEIVPFSTLEEIGGLSNVKLIQINGTHNNPEIPWNDVREFMG